MDEISLPVVKRKYNKRSKEPVVQVPVTPTAQAPVDAQFRWVMDQMGGPRGMLQEIVSNPKLKEQFYSTVMPKLMAMEDKQEVDRFSDDGRDQLKLIAQIAKAIKARRFGSKGA